MNYKNLGKILGKIMILEGVLMLAPLAVSLIYRESFTHILAFLVPVLLLVVVLLCAVLAGCSDNTATTPTESNPFAGSRRRFFLSVMAFSSFPFVFPFI